MLSRNPNEMQFAWGQFKKRFAKGAQKDRPKMIPSNWDALPKDCVKATLGSKVHP
jgi:hypothetical protein